MGLSDKVSMYYDARFSLFGKAKMLRYNMTSTESALWKRLKKKQLLGLRFRAQHPIDIFIADFYCHKLKLVVEVDGAYHNRSDQKKYDLDRERVLKNYGIETIRFTDEEIESSVDTVIEKLEKECRRLMKDKGFTIPPAPLTP